MTKRITPKPETGRNKFPMFPLRPEEDGQLEAWKAAAKRAKLSFSKWIRAALDKESGRKP